MRMSDWSSDVCSSDLVAQEGTPGSRVAGAAPRPPPAAQHPQRLLVEVLRQIADRRPDFVVHRMALAVGGVAQGNQLESEAALLQSEDLLRDEGLEIGRAHV